MTTNTLYYFYQQKIKDEIENFCNNLAFDFPSNTISRLNSTELFQNYLLSNSALNDHRDMQL